MSFRILKSGWRPWLGLAVTLVLLVAPSLEAMAVQAPRPGSSLYMQTSGPNAGLTIGDYYTSPAGGDTDHLFMIRVPSDWPSGTAVTVALYDPELGLPNPASPTAADEVRGAADSSRFRLESPSGSAVGSATYSDLTTNGSWTALATFDPGATGTGTYLLRVQTSDNDDNSWRVDASHDPDCAVGGPDSCDSTLLVNGNEVSRAPSGSGSLAVGVIRTSWQHAGPGSSCQDHYFYVNGSTPRPLRAHNFDMDGNGTVTYTTPNGATVAGTVSGNGTWNNSSDANRVGDILPEVNGWWKAEICISSTNQYVFEAPSAGPSFPEPQPAPRLEVTKDDGQNVVAVGDIATYSIVVSNVSDADPLPGEAYDVVAVDVLPDGTEFVECTSADMTCVDSGGTVTATLPGQLLPGESVSFDVRVRILVDVEETYTNTVSVGFSDHLGNDAESVSGSDTNTVDFSPSLELTVNGPVEVLRGDVATLTYTLSHGSLSDGSDVSNITIDCSQCSAIVYADGDENGNGILEGSETWTYTATIPTGPGDPDPLSVTADVNGADRNDEPVNAEATGFVDIIEPASLGGFLFEDLNGNGVADSGEPGIDGVEVTLTDSLGTSLALATSGGFYEFTDLAPGSYTVETEGPGAPYVFTTGSGHDVTLGEGESVTGLDFGLAIPVTIAGSVFHDLDHDGVNDVGEGGLEGIEVNLFSDGAQIATTTTDESGDYTFQTLPGEYTVSIGDGIPNGWALRTPGSIALGLVLSGGSSENNDFGASNTPPVMYGERQRIEVGQTPLPLVGVDAEGDTVSFSVVSGQLPDGLALNPDGTFSGTATTAGTFEFTVRVCDQADPVACADFDYEIEVVEAVVAGIEVLPFTGIDTEGFLTAALLLTILGIAMVGMSRLVLVGSPGTQSQ